MPLNPADFFARLLPEAERLRQQLGAGTNAVPVFLAQWAHESGFESDRWIGGFNYSGVTDGGPPNFRTFKSPEEHTRAQAAALTDPNYTWGYGLFLQAARENEDPRTLARYLGASPWDAGNYQGDGGRPGQALVDTIERYGLDRLAATPAAADLPYGAYDPSTGRWNTPGGGPSIRISSPIPMPEVPQTARDIMGKDSPGLQETAFDDDKGFFKRLSETLFSAAWWKRAGQLLIMLVVAVLLIALAVWGMMKTPPAPAGGEEG